MSDLKFANTHNLVAFLDKPTKSEGFEEIVDFLNANPIKYALTVNPTIYTSCIKQFWDTVKVKTVNGEVQLQALVDGKKVIIIASTIRRDLQLEDAEGTNCLPNATIFEQLTLMGIVKNVDSMVKFWMYPRFSGTITPLFQTMMVQAQEEIGEGSANPTDPHHTPIITQPSTSKPQKKQKPRKPKRKDTKVIMRISKHGRKIDDIDKDAEVTLVDETQGRNGDDLVFDTIVLDGEEVFAGYDVVEKEVSTADPVNTAGEVVTTATIKVSVVNATPVSAATTTTTTPTTTVADEVEMTLAQTLIEIKSTKPKEKGIVMQEPKPEKPLKRKDQIMINEEIAQRLQEELQAELEEEERLAKQREEAVNTAEWDDAQAMIDADYELATRL
ncbi:hypothetical protein Tco_0054367 [Tanacetum coccineum]